MYNLQFSLMKIDLTSWLTLHAIAMTDRVTIPYNPKHKSKKLVLVYLTSELHCIAKIYLDCQKE